MSKVPPPVINSAKLLSFANVDDTVRFTNKMTLYVDGERLGKVGKIALCENYSETYEILAFFCDDEWEPIGITAHIAVEEAKERIERTYEGVHKIWIESPYSENEVNEFLVQEYGVDANTSWWIHECSFCGKSESQVESLFESTNASICNECIDAFYEAVHSKSK